MYPTSKQVIGELMIEGKHANDRAIKTTLCDATTLVVNVHQENYELKKIITAILGAVGQITIERKAWAAITPDSSFSMETLITGDVKITRKS